MNYRQVRTDHTRQNFDLLLFRSRSFSRAATRNHVEAWTGWPENIYVEAHSTMLRSVHIPECQHMLPLDNEWTRGSDNFRVSSALT